jgi:glycosyltransferase involved in cell wall biosynthesis
VNLNWFSPLPPLPSGIAELTARLVPTLCRSVRLTLWTAQSTWDRQLERWAPVVRYDPQRPPWRALASSGVSIYHLGNAAEFHEAIWAVSRRLPGIVALHDLSLQHLFLSLHHRRQDWGGYCALMVQHYGPEAVLAASELWHAREPIDAAALRYPLLGPAVEGALGVLAHSTEAAAALRATGYSCPIAIAPLPYTPAPRPSTIRGAAGPPFYLVAFGHLGSNRSLEAVLEALATLPRRHRFRLDIYGRVWNEPALTDYVRTLGLDEIVTLHGFVTDARLDAALERAHLAINLRHPTMGEVSLSQLRIWDHALPSLVSRVGWYATLGDDIVAFVDPAQGRSDIQEHLEALAAEPARFIHMGLRAREHLARHHDPALYVRELQRIMKAAESFRPRAAAWRMAERAALATGSWATVDSAGTGLLERVLGQILVLTGGNRDRRDAPPTVSSQVACREPVA